MYENNQKTSLITNAYFRLFFTLIWFILGAVITIIIILYVFLGGNINTFRSEEQLRIYIEIVSVGLVPILFVILGKDDLEIYGFSKKKIGFSMLLRLIFLILDLLYNFIRSSLNGQGQFLSYGTPAYSLRFPDKLVYTILGLLAYGPLEVFFVIFLLINMEKMLHEDTNKVVTKSAILTAIIFGLLHLITTQSIENALTIMVIFFGLELIFKYTGNSFGPMFAWTIINSYNWYLLQWLFL